MESPQQQRQNGSSRKRRIRSPYFRNKKQAEIDVSDDENSDATLIRGLHETVNYAPPESPYNLIQEKLYKEPWKMLLATIFLHKTNGKVSLPLFWKFIAAYETPDDILKEDEQTIAAELKVMGLSNKRAKLIKRFSYDYLNKNWKYPIELYGIGKYGNDSYRIFCLGQRNVKPNDTKLNLYHDWLKKYYGEEVIVKKYNYKCN